MLFMKIRKKKIFDVFCVKKFFPSFLLGKVFFAREKSKSQPKISKTPLIYSRLPKLHFTPSNVHGGCAVLLISVEQTDRQTDRQTNKQTDKFFFNYSTCMTRYIIIYTKITDFIFNFKYLVLTQTFV